MSSSLESSSRLNSQSRMKVHQRQFWKNKISEYELTPFTMNTFHKSKSMYFTSQRKKSRKERHRIPGNRGSNKNMRQRWSKTTVTNPRVTTQQIQVQTIQCRLEQGDQSINKSFFFFLNSRIFLNTHYLEVWTSSRRIWE